jgi:hypothetical protein
LLRQAADVPRRVGWKAHGLANDFVRSAHTTIIHQNGDARSSALGASVPHYGMHAIAKVGIMGLCSSGDVACT